MTDKTRVLEAVDGLSRQDLEQVIRFIDSLKSQRRQPPPGSVEAVLRAAGTWWMSPDETRQFLIAVEEMRHQEDAERAIPPQY